MILRPLPFLKPSFPVFILATALALTLVVPPSDAQDRRGRTAPAESPWIDTTAPLSAETLDAAVDESMALYQQGRWAEAEALMRRIDAAMTELLGPLAEETLLNRTALANAISNQDREDEAMALFREILDGWEQAYGPEYIQTVRARMNLAMALGATGRPNEGIPMVLAVLRDFEARFGPEATSTILARYNLAGLYEQAGYWDEALGVYAEVIPLMEGRAGSREVSLYANMLGAAAALALDYGDLELAAGWYAKAIPAAEAAFGAGYPGLVNLTYKAAEVMMRTGAHTAGYRMLERARDEAVRHFGEVSFPVARADTLMGTFLVSPGPGTEFYGGGVQMLLSALEAMDQTLGPTHPETIRALAPLLQVSVESGAVVPALMFARRARASGEVQRVNHYAALRLAIDAGEMTPQAAAAEAFEVAQLTRRSRVGKASQTLATRLALAADGSGADTALKRYTDLLLRREAVQAVVLDLSQVPPDERSPGTMEAAQALLEQTTAEADAALKDLLALRPDLTQVIGDGVLTLAAAQALLPPDAALVVMDLAPAKHPSDGGEILVVTADGVAWQPVRLDTGEMAALAARVRDGVELRLGVRGAVALGGNDQTTIPGFDTEAAAALYDGVFGPVADVLSGHDRLFLDLRGPLTTIPPQLLIVDPSATSPDWMIRHHAMTVLPSAAALVTVADAGAEAPEPFYGIADPVFSDTAGLPVGLVPLPETLEEALQVAAASGADAGAVHAGAEASEAAVKAADLSAYRVLYFATHGLVAGDLVGQGPLAEPALAMTAGPGEDGFLTATEVAELTLNADWVVLSACNTARGAGEGADAEALSGLARAFVYAGARALLVSHWPVESRSAVALMTGIFQRRAADPGLSAAEAQRQAILSMIDAPADPAWSHPAFWAPFVLVGSPDRQPFPAPGKAASQAP